VVAAALTPRRTAIRIAVAVVLVLAALAVLALSAQNSAQFGRLQPWILLVSVAGVTLFAVLLARKVMQLVRAWRNHEPGSRLTTRTVTVFGMLVVLPLLTVYVFSLEFLNRGIDSWFRVEIKQGLNDALVLSRAALDLRMREHAQRTEDYALRLSGTGNIEAMLTLDDERRGSGALDLVLYGEHERILAASSSGALEVLPERPPDDLIRQVSDGRPFVMLEPVGDAEYVIRTAAPVPGGGERRYVVATYEVPRQLAALTDAVQRSYSQYGDLAALREPLKYSFRLTLTMVLLVTMLAAIYGAIFFAQLLFKPVQDLMEGTRAVAKGDFGTRLPLTSRDEMGFLVHSFNDMTKRLRRAREETERSRQEAERERERLAVILARLSTGVLVIDRDLVLRIANASAGTILGVDLAGRDGQSLLDMSAGSDALRQLVEALRARFAAGREEWREQLELAGEGGGRALVCACVPLPDDDVERRSYVIVFDEVTRLLQAQRDAAWGEVARRLAHEIKNPLTPIQLAAERVQRRFGGSLGPEDAQVLERATSTIVNQVETMKRMVNAFSEYARSPEMHVAEFDLNGLVVEAAELFRPSGGAIEIVVRLDPAVGMLEADRGRIRQVLNNLLTNAIEALEGVAGARVEVATETVARDAGRAAQAAIVVSDNGPGFARELLPRIFDPYVTSKQRGTGLGLAIVKKIVEEHGGSIEADNRPEGGGRVRVMLPVKDSSRLAVARERRTELRRERA
jgi:nitrogen fixation/metabolism regulation signal transduction histidine kinase